MSSPEPRLPGYQKKSLIWPVCLVLSPSGVAQFRNTTLRTIFVVTSIIYDNHELAARLPDILVVPEYPIMSKRER